MIITQDSRHDYFDSLAYNRSFISTSSLDILPDYTNYLRRYLGDSDTLISRGEGTTGAAAPTSADLTYLRRYLGDL